MVLNRANTNDLLQIIRPHKALSPNVCALCFKDEETYSHLFLHCSVARKMWLRLMAFSGECWVAPKGMDELLRISWVGFGWKKDKFMEVCALFYSLMFVVRVEC